MPSNEPAQVDGGSAIGAPCTPSREDMPPFRGFDLGIVYMDAPNGVSPPSGHPICLTYHFLGVTTCPYGQDQDAEAPAGAHPCLRPDGDPVVGEVPAQCTDRRPDSTVFWSCRCANADGGTNDGAEYCSCPSGMTCTPGFASSSATVDSSGSYCLTAGAAFNQATACKTSCDPVTAPCP